MAERQTGAEQQAGAERRTGAQRPAGSLRERKKLRTRQALVETALDLFTERGFAAVTLDELVDAVEVSKRTFFRTFASKDDVALAPERELWGAYADELAARPVAGAPVFATFVDALYASVTAMAEGWERRFLASRALAEGTPALNAHSLRHCSEVSDAVVRATAERLAAAGASPGDVQLRLLLELMLAAWRCALREWTEAADGERDRAALLARMDEAFAQVPAVLALAGER
ncbi:TetR family transcriptional regulator [Streptomyces sp. NPDC050504]|uniref:TetR family transcriptional regulator n=1 Tax=Streptomyces sp. NPDC050504 TaxID=3365618 RepID=UPI00379F5F77